MNHSVAYNLRLPGQYYDQETGQYYNYFRDYDSQTGRYVESDPIGLRAGVNTYSYVGNSPVSRADPLGLFFSHIHAEVTAEAVQGSGLGADCISQAIAGAIAWDFASGSQDPSMAFTHSMAVSGQSAPDAAAAGNQFIHDQVAKCDCAALGFALHTAQDSAAGGHQYKAFTSLISIGMIAHYFEDMYPSKDRVTEALVKSRNVVSEYKKRCATCSK